MHVRYTSSNRQVSATMQVVSADTSRVCKVEGIKGEIFALTNLFKYQDDGAVVLRDIVSKTNVAESKADVRVVDIDIKDEDNDAKLADGDDFLQRHKLEPVGEEEAMSQIVAMITGEEDRKRARRAKSAVLSTDDVKRPDPILAILQSVGVEYTHENSEVIGSSKVEARLSKAG